ncbi:hypothetical protein [Streptomyces phaeoluteigriseus]|nr:hypothetical protein [Streptomyces phaeoluteigriseus]
MTDKTPKSRVRINLGQRGQQTPTPAPQPQSRVRINLTGRKNK